MLWHIKEEDENAVLFDYVDTGIGSKRATGVFLVLAGQEREETEIQPIAHQINVVGADKAGCETMICEFCHEKPIQGGSKRFCSRECYWNSNRVRNRNAYRERKQMGAQGKRRVVKQPFELTLVRCLGFCDKDFLSEGKHNRICPVCTMAQRSICD